MPSGYSSRMRSALASEPRYSFRVISQSPCESNSNVVSVGCRYASDIGGFSFGSGEQCSQFTIWRVPTIYFRFADTAKLFVGPFGGVAPLQFQEHREQSVPLLKTGFEGGNLFLIQRLPGVAHLR